MQALTSFFWKKEEHIFMVEIRFTEIVKYIL